ncbi:MAG: uracil-DNA glycosylase, partial [Bacteroidetes bacterium]
GLVFMLWGSFAKKKSVLIDPFRHLILEAAHPSPLAAHKGFIGCRHFSKANDYLRANGKEPIAWQLPT